MEISGDFGRGNESTVAGAALELLRMLKILRKNKLEEEYFQRLMGELGRKNKQIRVIAIDEIKLS